jgi:serine/threonine protein kinase
MHEPDLEPASPLDPGAAGRILRALDDTPIDPPTVEPKDVAGEPDAPALPRVPGYMLIERIAEGGGGTVYRAVREGGGSDRVLALKLLRVRAGAGPEAQRAWRELNVLESLRIPCVPRLVDYGQADGHLYIVTEFVEGEHPTLGIPALRAGSGPGGNQDSARGTGPPREQVELLARIADAAQLLHEHGVIHRDIKPSNILVTRAGQVVLLDLGLATLLADSPVDTLTEDGRPIGTLAYMAPEQARGERSRISTRTDVYALGAVGYSLLMGQTPHDCSASIHEMIRRVAHDAPRPARQLEASLPRPLAAVLEKACAAGPERRYGSAGELAEDLRRWLRGDAVLASPPTLWTRATRWMGRYPVRTTATACAAVALLSLVLSAVSIWFLNAQPWRVDVAADASELRLVTRSGRIIRAWPNPNTSVRPFGEIMSRPDRLGGGRVVVLMPAEHPDDPESSHQIAFFNVDDLQTPFFSTPVEIPRSDDAAEPDESFAVNLAMSGDFIPQVEGTELLVVHQARSGAPACIRIYDLGGSVLFEAWHKGSVSGLCWLEPSRTLVCVGANNERLLDPVGTWPDADLHPQALFAITLGSTGPPVWLNGPDAQPDTRSPWYRKLAMPSGAPPMRVITKLHHADFGGREVAVLSLHVQGRPFASIDLFVSAEGDVVGTDPKDGYLNDAELALLRDYRLEDFRPRDRPPGGPP